MGDKQISVGKLEEYVDALEKERRKIEVFQRELPLCMQLVAHAIEGCKQQIVGSGKRLVSDGPSDCEVTSNEGPVLEEFIPLKRSSQEEDGKREGTDGDETSFAGEKPDWLRSVQLWAHDNDPPSKLQERRSVIEPNKSNGAFHPFCRDDKVSKPAASSTAESGGTTNDNAARLTGQRKTRRCWSAELHKRFLQALEQLGGCRASTPKQIKELMKVDGLTNDEVKSHLQKYRLHNRRPGHAAQSTESNGDAQAPQFVVVGGIWVPPAADSGRPGTKVYAPKARFPSRRRRQDDQLHMSAGSRGANSGESPATSTSSHVTATSPAT